MRYCTQRDCRVRLQNPKHFICRDCWDELCDRVQGVFDHASIAYMGRSFNPRERLIAHWQERGLEQGNTVFVAKSADEAMAIEEALIRKFSRLERDKIDNISDFSDGSVREGRNYIYVAFTR